MSFDIAVPTDLSSIPTDVSRIPTRTSNLKCGRDYLKTREELDEYLLSSDLYIQQLNRNILDEDELDEAGSERITMLQEDQNKKLRELVCVIREIVVPKRCDPLDCQTFAMDVLHAKIIKPSQCISFIVAYYNLISNKRLSKPRYGPFPLEVAVLVTTDDAIKLEYAVRDWLDAFDKDPLYRQMIDELEMFWSPKHHANIFKEITRCYGKAAGDEMRSNETGFQTDHVLEMIQYCQTSNKKRLEAYIVSCVQPWLNLAMSEIKRAKHE